MKRIVLGIALLFSSASFAIPSAGVDFFMQEFLMCQKMSELAQAIQIARLSGMEQERAQKIVFNHFGENAYLSSYMSTLVSDVYMGVYGDDPDMTSFLFATYCHETFSFKKYLMEEYRARQK